MRGFRGRRAEAAALVAVLLLALGMRLHRLERLSLWTDEGYAVWFASQPLGDFGRLARRDTCLPLSYLITKPFIAASLTDSAARLPAVLFGVGSIAVVWALGRRVAGRTVGLGAALLLAVHPLHLHYSQEARMYTEYLFFLSASTLLLLRFTSRPGWGTGLLLAASLAASMYVHNAAAVWMAVMVLALAPWRLAVKRPRRLLHLTAVGALALALLWPMLPVLRTNLRNVDCQDWWMPYPSSEVLRNTLHSFLFFWPQGERNQSHLTTATFRAFLVFGHYVWLGVLAAGLALAAARRQTRLLALAAWGVLAVALLILISAQWRSLIGERIMLPLLVPMALVEAYALLAPWREGGNGAGRHSRARLGGDWRTLGRVAAALSGLVLLAFSVIGAATEYTCQRKEDWRTAVEALAANCRPGEVVLTREGDTSSDVSGRLEQRVLAWYLAQQGMGEALRRVPVDYFTSLDFVRGTFEAAPARAKTDPRVQQALLARELAAGRRVWFIKRDWDELTAQPGRPDERPPAFHWGLDHARHRRWIKDFVSLTLFYPDAPAAGR
jgi:mannosyltransferase